MRVTKLFPNQSKSVAKSIGNCVTTAMECAVYLSTNIPEIIAPVIADKAYQK